jgi:hypothetical protein
VVSLVPFGTGISLPSLSIIFLGLKSESIKTSVGSIPFFLIISPNDSL